MVDYYKLAYCLLVIYGNSVRSAAPRPARCEVRARIDSGWVCGARRRAAAGAPYASFRGVPYARQPVGRLRFQELRPVTPWKQYRDATEEGPVCPQHDEVYGRLTAPARGMSEACIFANVHVPLKDADDGIVGEGYGEDGGSPILVYIHGGGFQAGSGDADLNGPEYLLDRNVIVITFNYRINVFGFLSLGSPEVPGNQALRDQVTLLRWVRRNARAFGGDPDDVTLMGQSAGAACAHLLSLSKATDGLFRRVILSSGTANPGFYTSSPLYAQAVAALFLAQLGVNSTDPTEIHKQLVKIPLQQILLANSNVQYRTGIISFAPVVESRFPGVTRILDDEPTELIKRGRGKHYPMLVGVNTLECGYFDPRLRYLDFKGRVEANPTLLLNPEIVFRTPPDLTQRLARVAIRRYFKARFTYDEYVRSCSETLFVYPAFELANLRAATKGAPVFLYQFAYQSQLNYVQESGWLKQSETLHIEDFVKIFKPNAFSSVVGAELPAEDKRMKNWMTNIVVNFIRCSTPTCTRKTERSPWPAVQQGKYNYQRIEKPGVFLNRGPTPEQWHMIEYFKYLEAESKRAAAAPVPAAPSDAAVNNVIAQFSMARPRYPLAVLYTTPRKLPRFKHINSVQT